MGLKSASLMGTAKLISTVPSRKQALANSLMYKKHPSHSRRYKEDKTQLMLFRSSGSSRKY